MALFELGLPDQRTAIEMDDHPDGRPVLRLRRGMTAIDDRFINELNQLIDWPPSIEGKNDRRVVVVVIK